MAAIESLEEEETQVGQAARQARRRARPQQEVGYPESQLVMVGYLGFQLQ
jgi:hypothetical protein